MTARNEYLHNGKPMEDVDDLILKIIDAPLKETAGCWKSKNIASIIYTYGVCGGMGKKMLP